MKSRPEKKWQKRYIDVLVKFRADGHMVPQAILWDAEHRYPIKRVLNVIPRAAYGTGGQGDCYTVLIEQGDVAYERQLFFERSAALSGSELGRWFVEVCQE